MVSSENNEVGLNILAIELVMESYVLESDLVNDSRFLLINIVLSTLSWLMIFITRRISIYVAFIYPLVHLNLLYIALVSWIRSEQGKGYVWKGRLVS